MENETSKPKIAVLEVAMELALTDALLESAARQAGAQAAREAAMSTSVGGIGPLLRERIIAQAELGINVVGVSLLYETVWSQTWQAWNHLMLDRRVIGDVLRKILEPTDISFSLPLFDGTSAPVRVWKTTFGTAPVYYLDCPQIADVVYPCQEDAPAGTPAPAQWEHIQRLKHSWLIGRGSLALAKALDFKPDFIVQSETPTVFAHPRIVMDQFEKDPFFQNSLCLFNDHTPLEYAHPIWPQETIDLCQMNPEVYKPHLSGPQGHGRLDVTRLLVATADGVFGVSRKHGDVMRAMPSLKDFASKIQSITNGVSQPIWQHPAFHNPESLSDDVLLAEKEKLKKPFIEWMWRRARLWPVWAKTAKNKAFLVWTRRVTHYKRLDILYRVLSNSASRKRFLDTDIILVVGGRVYQRDNVSEKMVYSLVELLNQDEALWERVIFLDNFNVWEAPKLYHAADGAIMLADDGREASATGFMKAQMNGGLIIANSDGAIPEFVSFKGSEKADRPANGFGVDYVRGEPDAESFLKALEDFNAVYRDPKARATMMRAAIAVTPEVDVSRTAKETLIFYESLQVAAAARETQATSGKAS